MTKQALQQELKEKVKAGVKPSDLKKLKRSKSEGDIPKAPPISVPVNRSKSTEPFTDERYPYTTLISQQEELEKLRKETTAKSDTDALLRKKIESLEQNNPPSQLLTDQLQTKQQEIEELRKQLEITSSELNSLKSQHSLVLDSNLELKHQGLKDWWHQYEKTQELEQELKENVDYASDELINQDQTISQLQNQITHLKKTNQSLQKDLNLATKLAELRSSPFPTSSTYPYLKYALYTLLAVWFSWFLSKSFKHDR